jgi:hypothetical protein
MNGNKPSVLVFARKADDSLASFVKRLDDLVTQNKEKQARGTVVLLASKDEVATSSRRSRRNRRSPTFR